MLDCFKYMFKNKPLLLLVLSSVLGTLEGMSDMFSQYYYKLSLGIASLSIIASIPGVIMSFLAYSLIPWLEKRWSSKRILINITVFKVVVTGIIFLIGFKFYRDPKIIVPLLAIQGVFTNGIASIKGVIPTKMIGDIVDYMEYKTGERGEGMAFSLLTFISKLAGSLSTGIAAGIFPLIGLQEVNSQMQLVETGVNTRLWLWALVTVIPAILNLLSLIPIIFYNLEGEKLETIHKEVSQRREKLSKKMTAEHTTEER